MKLPFRSNLMTCLVMNSLLLSPKTAQRVEEIKNSNVHAIIIAGPSGSGKETLSNQIARIKLGLSGQSLLIAYPYFLSIVPDGHTIGIDRIRELQRFLSLKTTGKGAIRRVVEIVNAHLMAHEAQNALLKSLEEPPSDTIIILTTISILSLLPTIRSRAQVINVIPPSKQASFDYFNSSFKQSDIEKAYALSRGYTGLMHTILNQDDEHELFQYIQLAKRLLTAPAFERLQLVEELSKKKPELPLVFQGLELVCKAALVSRQNPQQSRKLISSLGALNRARSAYGRGANGKLVLTYLFIEM